VKALFAVKAIAYQLSMAVAAGSLIKVCCRISGLLFRKWIVISKMDCYFENGLLLRKRIVISKRCLEFIKRCARRGFG